MSSPKLVIVCGGRNYTNFDRVHDAIEEEAPTFIIQGGATGADRLARNVADTLMIPHIEVPALWGKPRILKAGYDRNVLMAKILVRLAGDNEKLVMAFPGGKGTKMMVDIAERMGIPVKLYD